MAVLFYFEYHVDAGRRQYSWHMEETVLSEGVFGRWYETEAQAAAAARAFQREACEAEIPDQPAFHATGPRSRT